MSVQSNQDLAAWQKTMDLVEAVYRATQQWPREEVCRLTNQARRFPCRPTSPRDRAVAA